MIRYISRAGLAGLALAGAALVPVPGTVSATGTGPTSCTAVASSDTLVGDASVTITLTFDAVGDFDIGYVYDGIVTGRAPTVTEALSVSFDVTRGWFEVQPTTGTVGYNYYALGADTPMCAFTLTLVDDTPTTTSAPPVTAAPPAVLPETGVSMTPVLATAGLLVAVGAALITRRRTTA